MREKNNLTISIIMIIISIIMVFPIFLLIMSALRPENLVFESNIIPSAITVENFKTVFQSDFLRSIKVSFIVAMTVTIVALLFHSMSGYALARLNFPGKKLIFIWMMSTLMIPFTVIMVPLYMITKELGMTNSYAGLIIPSIFNAYGIFLFRQFYLGFPKELEEAAFVEGCSRLGTFFRIVLPLSKPVILPLTVAFFLGNWNNYLWPLIVNQKEELWVVQVALGNMVGGYSTPWNIVLASAVVAAVPTFLLFFILQKQFVEGIKMSGIK